MPLPIRFLIATLLIFFSYASSPAQQERTTTLGFLGNVYGRALYFVDLGAKGQ